MEKITQNVKIDHKMQQINLKQTKSTSVIIFCLKQKRKGGTSSDLKYQSNQVNKESKVN